MLKGSKPNVNTNKQPHVNFTASRRGTALTTTRRIASKSIFLLTANSSRIRLSQDFPASPMGCLIG